MSNPADTRHFGLSPRAQRLVIPVILLAIVVIIVGTYANRRTEPSGGTGPVVGGDLHAVGQLADRLFVGGHGGAGYRITAGGWTQIPSLDDKDVMGWAQSTTTILAGGHAGLYTSTDGGSTFSSAPVIVSGKAVSDIHGLGASNGVVYVASPQAGTLVSTDGGKTYSLRGQTGRDFMGTIWIDPSNPDTAIAPSMQQGAVETADGGRTWSPLGTGTGAMAVAVNATGQSLVALGMDGAQQSTDGGRTWHGLSVPEGTSAATYTPHGDLIVAALSGDRATVYRQTARGWDSLA